MYSVWFVVSQGLLDFGTLDMREGGGGRVTLDLESLLWTHLVKLQLRGLTWTPAEFSVLLEFRV